MRFCFFAFCCVNSYLFGLLKKEKKYQKKFLLKHRLYLKNAQASGLNPLKPDLLLTSDGCFAAFFEHL